MPISPAIVVCTYNRPRSLSRLLHSIASAHYDQKNIPLIISIDQSDSPEVSAVAEGFYWEHGPKRIISHQKHLGLKQHILMCGDLSLEFGSVIVLEDDLMVSPWFYSYATEAQNYYQKEAAVAGISLYGYEVTESEFYVFQPVDDGTDVYFMQVASSWGQLWTQEQWTEFRNWLANNPTLAPNSELPAYLLQWGEHSWKKHFIHYLISSNKYFVFPRVSLSTNFGEQGTNACRGNFFQTRMQVSFKEFLFCPLDESGAIYDAWFEINARCLNRLAPHLADFNYVVDLYGSKDLAACGYAYALTKKKPQRWVRGFSCELFPYELNVALSLEGEGLWLCETAKNAWSKPAHKIRNLLEEEHGRAEHRISFILPLENTPGTAFTETLNSMLLLEGDFETLIVSNHELPAQLKSCRPEHSTMVKSDTPLAEFELLKLGLERAKGGIVCFVYPGAKIQQGAPAKVASIFRSNLGLNWIRGVDETPTNAFDYSNVDSRPYRLTPGEAYQRLERQSLSVSMELDFFRRTAVNPKVFGATTLSSFLFEFLSHHQLNVVVDNFGVKGKRQGEMPLATDYSTLLKSYSAFKETIPLRAKLAERLFRSVLFKHDDSKYWYYPSFRNFPPVLRYDNVNQSYYFSKY